MGMERARYPLHIHHNLSPHRLGVILSGIEQCYDLATIAVQCGLSVSLLRKVLIPAVRQLGLLEVSDLRLNDLGRQFLRLFARYPEWFPEAAHLWLYTAHIGGYAKGLSWAYAQIVDTFWTAHERVLNGLALAQLTGVVVERASQVFGIPTESIAFSDRSIRGALNWLQGLTPPVLFVRDGKKVFRRRFFCLEITFLWAVDSLYRFLSVPHGVRLSLSPEHLEQLCRVCLLDPSGTDNVLLAVKRFSDYNRGGLFDFGTEGGLGRWILLAHPLPVPHTPEETER